MLTTLVVPEPDRLLIELLADHRDPSLAGLELGAHRRKLVGAVPVLRQLVREAAHEPAAGAGDLARVERELLLARHLERDGVEALEPSRAAERAATRTAAIDPLGLVTEADLAKLEARVEARGEVAHQLAEVHAMLGGEIEGDPISGEPDLDFREIHLELAQLDPLLTILVGLGLLLAVVVFLVEVLFGRLANDLAGHVAGFLELDEVALEEDAA